MDMQQSSTKKKLLIVYHTQFGATAQMAEAACAGARQTDDVDVVLKHAADASVDDVLRCDAFCVISTGMLFIPADHLGVDRIGGDL
jgi:flavorubredoxin